MRKSYAFVLGGLFVALDIVLGRALAVDVVFLRVSFSFVPIALAGAIFGPMWNGVLCVASDVLGFLLVPSQGAFHPGLTLSAFLSGFLYGLFLRGLRGKADGRGDARETGQGGGRSGTRSAEQLARIPRIPHIDADSMVLRALFASICVNILIHALLNTYWISTIYQKTYTVYFATRIVSATIMIPVQTIVITLLWRYLGKYIESAVIPKIAQK
ncbi:MAG: folate family ECF transporter S component [Clostridiales bacterium]|jgi:ECF transporter S component (folate family)|nr:folate family ECF transporter S component [Clostridiales bacterium]